MKTNLDAVDTLYTTLNALRPLKPEDQSRLDKKFRLEFNYNSNHIEGNTLTYGETELLLIFDDTQGNHTMREYEETKAHDVAYHMVEEWAKDTARPLTEQNIKNLNEIILVRPYWKDAITPDGQNTRRQIEVGDYKKYPNSVRLQNGELFEYASPTDTPILMRELIDWYRKAEAELDAVTLAAMLHYKFVRIHPFDDGNGRISRLLMNYVLLKFGYPPVIIKSSDKNNYLRALHLADVGNTEAFIDYIAAQVIWSLETSIKAAKGESLEDNDDFIKEIELLNRETSTKGTPKSPQIVYNTFSDVNNKLWNSILNTLKHFNTLFNETKENHTINNWKEIIKKKQNSLYSLGKLFEDYSDPEVKKIFGYELYENEFRKIGWEYKMYSLRGAKIPVDSSITLEIDFDHYSYNFKLEVSSTIAYKAEKLYGQPFLDDEIILINDALKKTLMNYIKSHINK